MIGSTNARPIVNKDWNISEETYKAGSNINKNDPVLLSSKFTNMQAITTITENLNTFLSNRSVVLSRDGQYILNLYSSSPYHRLYKRDSTESTYTRVNTEITISQYVNCAEFIASDKLLIGSSSSPFLLAYEIASTGVLTPIAVNSLGINTPSYSVVSIKNFSDEGILLVTDNSGMKIYRKSENTYSMVGSNISVNPTSTTLYNNELLLVGTASNPYLRAYRIGESTITSLTVPSSVTTNVISVMTIKNYLIVGSTTTLYTFSIGADYTLTLVSSTPQGADTYAMNMTPDNRYVIAAVAGTIVVYKVDYPATLVRYNYSPYITGNYVSILLTPQGEMLLIRSNNPPLSYKLENLVYKLDESREYSSLIEGYGYAKESRTTGMNIKISKFNDFSTR